MKLDKYTRRARLKSKGIKPLPEKGIYTAEDGTVVFDSEGHAERYVRHFTKAERVSRLWDHYGWYCDEYGHEMAIPCIALTGKVMLAGYVTNGGMVELEPQGKLSESWEDSQRYLASIADSMAERYAEKAREYNALWNEKMRLEEKAEDLRKNRTAIREEISGFIADIRESTLSAGLCARLRADMAKAIRRFRSYGQELRETLETLSEKRFANI